MAGMDQRRFAGLRWPGSTSVVGFGQRGLSGSGYRGNERSVSSLLHHHGSTMTRDLLLFLGGDNLNLVCREVEKYEAVRSCRPNVIAVLSDAAGKDEKVHTAEESNICTDSLTYGNRKDIQRESGARIVAADTLFQRLHIAFAGRKSEEAALMIEHIFKPVGVQFPGAHKIEENAGIKIATTSAHRNAACRSEAHGGVDGNSAAKSAEARSVTKVREDGSFGKLISEMMHQRLVGKAMKTVATNTCVVTALREW